MKVSQRIAIGLFFLAPQAFAQLLIPQLVHSPQQEAETFQVHGVTKHCRDITEIDSFRSAHYYRFFEGWAPADFQAARLWAVACSNYGWPAAANMRMTYLAQMQQYEYMRARQSAPVAVAPKAPPPPSQTAQKKASDQAVVDHANQIVANIKAQNAALAAEEAERAAAPPKPVVHRAYKPPATEPDDSALLEHGSYTNVDGEQIHSPAHSVDGNVPDGASAECNDGTYSFSRHARGTCSHHGGVAAWLN